MLWGRGGYNRIGKFHGIVELSENKGKYINDKMGHHDLGAKILLLAASRQTEAFSTLETK